MKECRLTRRDLLAAVPAACAVAGAARASAPQKMLLATGQYSWMVFYARQGRDFGRSIAGALDEVLACGLDGFEPMVGTPVDIDRLAPLLKERGLQMTSVYVNSTLHEAAQTEASITSIVRIAERAGPLGTRIVVTNPSPIRWGGPEAKNDSQLRTQAAALSELGRRLSALNMTLAYHNHDVELRNSAREFHHMMVGVDPKLVTLCLDAHWIYRGTGNSTVALFDIIELYGSRVTELHLRQSTQGTWTETFGDGDIDYAAVAGLLAAKRVRPHLVLELAVEKGTPNTLTPVEAHRRSAEYARQVFAGPARPDP
jgi:inosose dehydratase